MKQVVNRIEKIFPDLKIDNSGNNILLQTIRVPRELLFLTDKLPKPNYNSARNRHSTIEKGLPIIEEKFFVNPKSKLQLKGKEEVYGIYESKPTKLSPSLRRIKEKMELQNVRSKKYSNEKKMESIRKSKEFNNNSIEDSIDKEYSPDFEVENIHNGNQLVCRGRLIDKNQGVQISSSQRYLVEAIHEKYLREDSKNISPKIPSRKEIHRYDDQYLSDAYLKQVLDKYNRRMKPDNNMIISPIKDHLKLKPLSIVSKKAKSIKLPKVLLFL